MAVLKTGYTSHCVHDDMQFGENALAYLTMAVHLEPNFFNENGSWANVINNLQV
jgi:hypothetical protein